MDITFTTTPKLEALRNEVRSWLEGKWLDLVVVNDSHITDFTQVREGVGLGTTKKRLKGLYGTNHVFRFGAVSENKFQVEIRIPLTTQANIAE